MVPSLFSSFGFNHVSEIFYAGKTACFAPLGQPTLLLANIYDVDFIFASVQQAIGGYRADLPHTADVEMWMRFAVHSDIAYVRGADQAYYRVHGASMSVERVPIIDLLQRKAAYDAVFDAYWRLPAIAEVALFSLQRI